VLRKADKDLYWDDVEIVPDHIEAARELERVENSGRTNGSDTNAKSGN
jgi:hypothetical protein